MEIKKVNSSDELLNCTEVIHELRPHLKGKNLVALFKQMQTEKFEIAVVEMNNKVVAFIGFRYLTFLYSGKTLYIDDLCTLPAYRGKGCASKLLDYALQEATKNNIDAVTLDSGYHRHKAHQLYLNKGFILGSHHFHLQLTSHEL